MAQAVSAGAVDADAVTFIWRSARDKRVRDAHKHLDGKRAQFGQPFRSNIGPIRFPGDPEASAANTIGCRCWREVDVDFLRGVS